MTAILEFEQTEHIRRSIEENLFDLYVTTNQTLRSVSGPTDSFSWVKTCRSVWPNFIFNLAPGGGGAGDFAKSVVLAIDNEGAPPFIVTAREDEALETALEEQGIRKIMEWQGMACDIDNFSFVPSTSIHVTQAEDGAALDAWLNIVSTGLFGGKTLDASVFRELQKGDTARLYTGYQGGTPVCAAMLFYSRGVAGVYMVATLEPFRRKGFGSALMAWIMNEAKTTGYRTVVLQATEDGVPVYKKMGFVSLSTFSIFWKIGKTPR